MIDTFPLGSVKTVVLVPSETVQTNVINWEQMRADGNKFEILVSFGEAGQGETRWITINESPNYNPNVSRNTIISVASQKLGL